jgi:hypothetical protein
MLSHGGTVSIKYSRDPAGRSRMLVIKSVKVHGDTHKVLKLIKGQRRAKSMDEVVRELVKGATGKSVEQYTSQKKNSKLESFIQ